MADPVLDDLDRRLIAALQCDGRVTAERVAEVLDLPPRVVARRCAALLGRGGVRVVASRPRPPLEGVMLLHIQVLRGRIDAVAAALAARDDIPLVDLSAGGDQLLAILVSAPDHGNQLVFRQLPATTAVTSVDAQTVIHVFSDAVDWRLDVLTERERRLLTPRTPGSRIPASGPTDPGSAGPDQPDELDRAIIAALATDARTPAAALARVSSRPESTVRRRLAALFDQGQLRTLVVVDPRRLGLTVDANIRMRVPPERLDAAGRSLAAHPAVHGAFATTGLGNLNIAVWLRDVDHLYRFVTHDLAGLGVSDVDIVLIGRAVKRPGGVW